MSAELSPEFQEPSDTLSAVFSGRLKHWLNAIDEATPQEALQFGVGAVTELDRYWRAMGMMDQECLVSGIGTRSVIESEIDDDGDPTLSLRTENGMINGATGTSKGFTMLVDAGTGKPGLWHIFEGEEEGVDVSLTYSQVHFTRMFVMASSAEIVPIASIEMAGHNEDPLQTEEEIIEALTTGVASFDEFMASDRFRNMPNSEKGKIIDNLLSEIERTSQVRDAILGFVAEKIVRISANCEEGINEYDVINLPNVSLSGQTVGISMFHRELIPRLPARQGLTRPRSTGYLGLTVELGDETDSTSGFAPGSIVHIPLSEQQFGFQFATIED